MMEERLCTEYSHTCDRFVHNDRRRRIVAGIKLKGTVKL